MKKRYKTLIAVLVFGAIWGSYLVYVRVTRPLFQNYHDIRGWWPYPPPLFESKSGCCIVFDFHENMAAVIKDRRRYTLTLASHHGYADLQLESTVVRIVAKPNTLVYVDENGVRTLHALQPQAARAMHDRLYPLTEKGRESEFEHALNDLLAGATPAKE